LKYYNFLYSNLFLRVFFKKFIFDITADWSFKIINIFFFLLNCLSCLHINFFLFIKIYYSFFNNFLFHFIIISIFNICKFTNIKNYCFLSFSEKILNVLFIFINWIYIIDIFLFYRLKFHFLLSFSWCFIRCFLY
jgi:hypothetical protein